MMSVCQLHQRLVTQGARNLLEWLLFLVLVPCSLLYGGVSWLRNLLYDVALFSSYRSKLPIVSVGNLVAGGTGKTPVVDFLIKEFHGRGKRPVIISRGYGGSFVGDVGVVSNGQKIFMTAEEAGDEPFLLAKKNPSCAVLIAKKRVAGVKWVEENNNADLIILDDAFQHRAIARDVDIVLLDATRPLGNGWLLPAGSLREFKSSLKRADFLIMTRSERRKYDNFLGRPVYNSRHQLADVTVSLKGESVSVASLKDVPLLAFAGIATTESFFSSLENSGLKLNETLSFPDHVNYRHGKVLQRLQSKTGSSEALITTEKDAVKLSDDMFDLPCYKIAMTVGIDDSNDIFNSIFEQLWSE